MNEFIGLYNSNNNGKDNVINLGTDNTIVGMCK